MKRCWLSLLLFFGLLCAAFAEDPYTLVEMRSQTWRYNQSGMNLGSTWRANNYDDSAWPTGVGVFGRETDNNLVLFTNGIGTPLNLTNGTARVTTYYFRTHF